MPHVSLSNQRNAYIIEHHRAKTENEKIFFENVVGFIDSIINSTGYDTFDTIPTDKVFLSKMDVKEIEDELEPTDLVEYQCWHEWNNSTEDNSVVKIRYNGEFDVEDDRVVLPGTVWDRKTTYFSGTLKACWLLGKSKGYSLVGCDKMGQWAYFMKEAPKRIHGVGDYKLLYRSLHATFTPTEYYEPDLTKEWTSASKLVVE